MVHELFTLLPQYGVLGVVVAILMYQNHKITHKLFSVIEHNTQVMTRLTEIIETKVERRQ
jgi:hypothetical protein